MSESLIKKLNAISHGNLSDPMFVLMEDWNSAMDEVRAVLSQLTAAQSDNRALRARVAELNACINHAFHIASAKPQDYAIMMALGPNASEAWLLRQHAEAVNRAGMEIATELAAGEENEHSERAWAFREAANHVGNIAQRLRQQADELEK